MCLIETFMNTETYSVTRKQSAVTALRTPVYCMTYWCISMSGRIHRKRMADREKKARGAELYTILTLYY